MNRPEYTYKIALLLCRMVDEGEAPIGDGWKRSPQEQKRFFDLKLSQCDGTIKISDHQIGRALDIFFQDVGDIDKDGITAELIPPLRGWDYWHNEWIKMGGKPLVVFSNGNKDYPHFAG